MKWASLHNHTDYSLLDGISQPKKIIQRADKVGLTAISCSDHGNIRAVVPLLNAKKKAKSNVKIIAGNEFYINNGEGKSNSHLVVLAKNNDGWKSLVKATSQSNLPENFHRKPRLTIEQFEPYTKGNLICFSGHIGSDLSDVLFDNPKTAYRARSYDEVKSLVKTDWKKDLFALTDRYMQIFGKDNFFLEIQIIDQENLPACLLVAKTLRWLGKQTGLKCISTADSHYVERSDNRDQWVVLASNTGKTIPEISKRVANDDDDAAFTGFFRSNNYHIPSPEEMIAIHTEEEIKNSLELAESIEEINPFSNPIIPKFNCPDGKNPDEYLKEVCREGWKNKIKGKIHKDQISVYGDRIKHELNVLLGAGLADYFLILNDIANFVKCNKGLVNTGRGSAAGCLTSYLAGITSVDPIQFGLIFERFYNDGRNTAERKSPPDIDLDIQASFRDMTLNYIRKTYGPEKVGQIGTFGRLMGRSCLKEVLRVWDACPPKERDKITQFIPDESAIADDLQEMAEEEGESGIIRWALENNSKELKDWATLDKETGRVDGPFGRYFEQAMRIEGVHKSPSKHAVGVIIGNQDISDIVPIRYDSETGTAIIDVDMHTVEKLGLLKFDLCSVKVLDKIQHAQELIQDNWNA